MIIRVHHCAEITDSCVERLLDDLFDPWGAEYRWDGTVGMVRARWFVYEQFVAEVLGGLWRAGGQEGRV